jgi:hypothetical protein
MPDPTITIGSPSVGAIEPQTFTVSGTYSPLNPSPSITAVLKDPTGNVVATATNLLVLNGNWSGLIAAPGPYTGASVEASFPGADASVGNITVQ